MSLINEALKQARETHQQSAPPPGSNLQLRPAEPSQESRSNRGLMIPAALAVAALGVLYLAWQSQHQYPAAPLQVRGNTVASVRPTPAPQPVAVPAPPAPVALAPAAESQPVPGPTPTPTPSPSAAVAVSASEVKAATNTPVAVTAGSGAPSVVAPVEVPASKLGPAKLQAIVFSPKRPSVMINGKSLFIGEKLNGFRVTAIDRESVTLVGSGQTNVLTLPE
jgi:hypothetical protein